jgi:hypothetical protein
MTELAVDKRWPFFFRFGAGLTTPHRKALVKKYYIENMGNFHNQQPHNRPTHSSPNNIPVVKLRMRCDTHRGNRNVCGD